MKKKIYFGKETELAIRQYLRCTDPKKKELIYLKHIQPAFTKLVENIINMPKFNFRRMGEFSSLQNEVIAHLYTSLSKFNPRKRSKKSNERVKAFSYFGTIAKNYLVQKSIKQSKTEFYIEGSDGQEIDLATNSDLVAEDFRDQLDMTEFFQILIEFFEQNRKFYPIDKQKICDAVLYFLKNVEKETIYNKKHFYLLLKEYTGLTAKQITYFLNDFKKDYKNVRQKYFEETL